MRKITMLLLAVLLLLALVPGVSADQPQPDNEGVWCRVIDSPKPQYAEQSFMWTATNAYGWIFAKGITNGPAVAWNRCHNAAEAYLPVSGLPVNVIDSP